MDIVEHLATDHGYLKSLAARIVAELPCFVRARPQAAASLRQLLDGYVRYDCRIHYPREACLRDYLAGAAGWQAPATAGAWQALREAMARPLGRQARLDFRHALLRVLREGQAEMAREEAGLFALAKTRLSYLERHALALRASVYRGHRLSTIAVNSG